MSDDAKYRCVMAALVAVMVFCLWGLTNSRQSDAAQQPCTITIQYEPDADTGKGGS